MTEFTNITTVLFDLDGTIADTNEVILQTIAGTLEMSTGRSWHREEILPHWGIRLRDQLLILHPEIDLERAVPFYRRLYLERHRTLLAEFSGVRSLLEQLRIDGYHLGVVTSKKASSAQLTLGDIGYEEFFSLLVADEDTERHKPYPDPLLVAIERLGVSALEAIYVGDNPDDITAARAAGMGAVAVGWSLRPRAELEAALPHALIDAPGNLYRLLHHPMLAV